MAPIFVLLYTAAEFLIADLWDELVSDQIKCFLVNCATNTGGVITFDYDCFMRQLNERINLLDLTEEQLRLYGQIAYLIYFIGGIDALNLAGRTTEITSGDCGECGTCEDYSDTMPTELGPKTIIPQLDSGNATLPILPAVTPLGSYSSGTLGGRTGYISQSTYEGNPAVAVLVDLGRLCEVTAWSIETYSTDDHTHCDGFLNYGFLDADFEQIIPSYGGICWGGDSDWKTMYQTSISVNARYLFMALFGSSGSTVALKEIAVVVNEV